MNVDELAPIPVDLSKLGHVVKKDVVRKTVYDKLVAKVNSIHTSGFVLESNYDTDKTELAKFPELAKFLISGFVKKADYNTKITEIEGKIPDVSSLATKTALTVIKKNT